jgi:hypothetical protein
MNEKKFQYIDCLLRVFLCLPQIILIYLSVKKQLIRKLEKGKYLSVKQDNIQFRFGNFLTHLSICEVLSSHGSTKIIVVYGMTICS